MTGIMNELLTSFNIGMIYGVVAIGIYITFRVINFTDLTCDGSFVLGAATAVVFIKLGVDPWVATIAAFGAGAIAGLCTGIVHLHFKASDLLAGILVCFMLYSINLHVMGGVPNIVLTNHSTIFSNAAEYYPLLIVVSIIIATLTYILITNFGLSLRSIGTNHEFARSCGVNVSKMTLIGLMLSNAMIAVGGGIFSQHQEFVDISVGTGTVVISLASVMIGEKIFRSRTMVLRILSCVTGSILYRILVSIALHFEFFGLETQDLNLITGVMIIVIMRVTEGANVRA